MSALYFDCDPVNKRRSVTHVEDLRSLLMAMTSRRQRCLVLQILQNCSYRCYPVIKALRRVGFDKLLQAFIDAASAPAPQYAACTYPAAIRSPCLPAGRRRRAGRCVNVSWTCFRCCTTASASTRSYRSAS